MRVQSAAGLRAAAAVLCGSRSHAIRYRSRRLASTAAPALIDVPRYTHKTHTAAAVCDIVSDHPFGCAHAARFDARDHFDPASKHRRHMSIPNARANTHAAHVVREII